MSKKRSLTKSSAFLGWPASESEELNKFVFQNTVLKKVPLAERAQLVNSGRLDVAVANALVAPKRVREVVQSALLSSDEDKSGDGSPKRARRLRANSLHAALSVHVTDDAVDLTELPVSDLIRCRGCNRTGTVVQSEKQTRSADEPATEFFSCVHCRTRWRT